MAIQGIWKVVLLLAVGLAGNLVGRETNGVIRPTVTAADGDLGG